MEIEEIKSLINTWEYKTFIKFLKKEKLYWVFIKRRYNDDCLFNNIHWTDCNGYSDLMLITLGRELWSDKRLIYSQLWRFFLLEEIEKKPENTRVNIFSLKTEVIYDIKANGIRGCERLRALFDKYNFK